MRTSEPTLNVSPSATDEKVAGVNFTRSETETLQDKVDFAYRPRIARGFVPGRGWTYGCKIAGKVHLNEDYMVLAAKVDAYMASLCRNNSDAIEADLAFAEEIKFAVAEVLGQNWPHSHARN
jgi:hypothetical protein